MNLSSRTWGALRENMYRHYFEISPFEKYSLEDWGKMYQEVDDTTDWRGFGEKAHAELLNFTGHLPKKRNYLKKINKKVCPHCGQMI